MPRVVCYDFKLDIGGIKHYDISWFFEVDKEQPMDFAVKIFKLPIFIPVDISKPLDMLEFNQYETGILID